MHLWLRIGLIVVAVILFLMLNVLAFYFFKSVKKSWRFKILNVLKLQVKTEILLRADRVIIQIKKIVEKNNQYRGLLQQLIKLYDDIEKTIKILNRKIEHLKIKYLSYKVSEFNSLTKKLKADLQKLNQLDHNFTVLSYQFTEKDEFIRSEMIFLKNCLRHIIEQYKEIKVSLEEISFKISQNIKDLNDIEKDFDSALNIGEIKAASSFLDLYESKVLKLAIIVNEGPIVKSHIFKSIPGRSQNLINNFQEKRNQAPNQFSHIKIDTQINRLSEVHRQARSQFELLDIELAKISIRKCYQIISKINRNINLEINASNFFTQKYNVVVIEISQALQRYISLRKKYRIILDHGYQGQFELTDKFNELRKLSLMVDKQAIELKNFKKDIQVPFSSKLSKLKIILNLLAQFVTLSNEVERMIWIYNVESIIFKNKFQKLEAAINELVVNMRLNNILISNENDANLMTINKQILILGDEIYNGELTNEVKDKVDGFISKVTNLYSAIGGDLQIAEMAKNMISELTKQRSIDEKLGYVLSMAEKDYMIGKYTEALNNIITYLGEKSYVRI